MPDSSAYEKMDLFYLGREVDPASGKTSVLPLLFKNKNLTTHGVIIGMTGSGKTGLGICLMEEAAMDRLPAIIIDPKGDMANLLLTFPEMRPDDFLPWVDPAKAAQKEITREELACETAADWEKGIESWDQDKERIRRLRNSARFTVYTPGAESGRPVSVLNSLDAPAGSVMEESDTAASLVGSTVTSLLGLIGIQADPLSSREHILISSIILQHWKEGKDLSLELLIGAVVNPPFERVGVFPVESFFPQTKRLELAMQLNNILASPSFSGWVKGDPLRIESLLYDGEGKPRISIFSIAHLGEAERMFFVTMLLGRLVSWMRQQEGSGSLRCLLYMDEIFGYFPPLGNPPSKKPMLLLLKQARAYGLGVVLATQNPVDLDYKGLANIGTWFIGRLQTRQDQDRILQGIAGGADQQEKETIRSLLTDMRARTFLMYSAHLDEPVLFETRWVMSYLKGPISLAEVNNLPGAGDEGEPAPDYRPAEVAQATSTGEVTQIPPILPEGIPQCFVPLPVAGEKVTYAPWLAGRAKVRFYNQKRGIDEVQEAHLRLPLDDSFSGFEWEGALVNPVPPEETADGQPGDALFRKLPSSFSSLKSLEEAEKALSNHLYHTMTLPLFRVPGLKLESKPGETEQGFRQQVADYLQTLKEADQQKLEETYGKKQQQLEQRLDKINARVEREKEDVRDRGLDTALSFGIAVLGALFGRKAMSVTTATRSARGMRSAGRMMKEKGDVQRAADEAERAEEDIAALAEELQGKFAEITERYISENYPLETFSINPRRSDIFAVQVAVQWEPELDLKPVQ